MNADPDARDWRDRLDERLHQACGRPPAGTTWREYYRAMVADVPPLPDAVREQLALLLTPEGQAFES